MNDDSSCVLFSISITMNDNLDWNHDANAMSPQLMFAVVYVSAARTVRYQRYILNIHGCVFWKAAAKQQPP